MRALVLVAIAARAASADDWRADRTGLVVETSLGGGAIYHGPWGLLLSVLQPSPDVPSSVTLAMAGSAGVGYWLEPRLALTAHAEISVFQRSQLAAFVGPALQYWLPPLTGALDGKPTLFIGGGLGVALARPFHAGFGIDARVGLAIGSVIISIEGTEGIFYNRTASSVTIGGVALVGFELL